MFPVAQKGASSNDAFARLTGSAFAAYGTGTVLHADPELSGSDVAVTIDMAASDAVYAAQDVSAFADELGRPIVAALPAGSGRAHAQSVKLDPPDAAGEIDTGLPADAAAPPTSRPVVRDNRADLTPILKADTLRAEAAARAVSTGCVLGDDLARADASADDTDVADADFDPKKTKPLLSLSGDDPARAVSHSKARTYLVPISGRPGRFGAVSELRQTIAPITFGLPGTDEKFTIEVGGEWVMRASADGGKGAVSFGPENSSGDQRPVIRLIRGNDVLDEVMLRDAGGRTGIFVDAEPVGDIRIGGDSRAVLGRADSRPTQTPTRVSAAGDVVVVRLFEPHAELHVGHMEVGLAVPAGGVSCPGIKLTKTSDPASVRPGEPFAWNIEVSNPNDCVLDQVKVTDIPSATPGLDWRAMTSVPKATRAPDGSLVFESIGPIGTGETRPLRLNAEVDPSSALGTITNRATAVGVCGGAPQAGSAEATTGVGTVLVPALPRPATGIASSDRPAPHGQADSSNESASGVMTSTSSISLTRAAVTRSAAAAGADKVNTRAETQSRTAVGPLPKSGADTALYVTLAVAFLATGRVFRRVKKSRPA